MIAPVYPKAAVAAEVKSYKRVALTTRVVFATFFVLFRLATFKGRLRALTLTGMDNIRARGWCFTMYGDLDEKENMLKQLEKRYVIAGREICPTTGKNHLQGFIYFHQKRTRKNLKETVDAQAHWEASRGTPQDNARYCKKDGKFWEMGIMPMMGGRSDREAVAERVRDGASLEEVAEENPGLFVLYHRGLTALKSQVMKHRTEGPKVSWLWGLTGVGKTRTAVQTSKSFYMKDGTQWWDGYNQEECIIIDDFDGKWPFRDLLRLLDYPKYQGQCKGGYVKINSPKIVITCEYPPSHFWSGNELAQILRRIHEVTHLERP